MFSANLPAEEHMLKECKWAIKFYESVSFFSSKTFEFQGFKQLVDQIAESKKTSADQITAQLGSSGGPSLAGTTVRSNENRCLFFLFLGLLDDCQ